MSSPHDHEDDLFSAANLHDASSGDPPPGARIGAYEVVRPLARGGMATVLEVRDERTGVVMALKLLLPLAHAEEARSRFRREFRALSRLQHPNVLAVHEWGLLGDRPWFSMERVSGHDLRGEVEHLATLEPVERFERVERILKEVTRALTYIHERGLVHRDVTPGNIMVQLDGSVKIMDFGVVKEMGADLTAVGEVIGTIAWMAPEQITSSELDARADLYSLGCVLYFLLTGKRPFNAHTIHGFMEKHLHEVPISPRQADPQVPALLDAVCMRLLEKRPADRYASAAHLQHVLGDQAQLETSEWPPRTVGRARLRAKLRDGIDDLAQHGVGAAFLIGGANGLGKTRLLDLCLGHARRMGLRVTRGRARPQDRPFGLFFGIFERLERERPNPLLDQVFAGEVPTERYPIIAAFKDLLLANAPVVVACDDIQHADAASLELLTYLLRNTLELTSEQVMFVLGFEGERLEACEVASLPFVQRDVLKPLGASEVEELVVSVLGSGSAAIALAHRIHDESGGSPAFITDMLRGLLDDGLIVREDNRYRINIDEAEITRSSLPMPASLRQALKERIAPLSANALQVGCVVALARRRLQLDVLLEVVGLEEDDAIDALDELVDHQIVMEERDADVERVELSHSRFHDVLLEAMDLGVRTDLHRRMGESLERQHRGRTGPMVEELAFHFQQAGLALKAFAFLQLSIERHVRQSLFGEAMGLIGRALQLEPAARPFLLLDDADTRLVELYLQRSMAEHALAQSDDSLASARKAQDLARIIGNPALQSRVATALGERLRSRGEHTEGARQLEVAVNKAREAGDQTLLPPALYMQASHNWSLGDLPKAIDLWQQALAIATTVGDHRNAAWANNGLGIGHTCMGDTLKGRHHFEQAASQMEQLGMAAPLAIIRCNLAEMYMSTGILRKALGEIDKAIEQSREIAHPHGVAVGLLWRANVLRVLNNLEDAERTILEALRTCREHRLEPDEIATLVVLAELRLDQGQPAGTLEALDRAEPILARFDNEGLRSLFLAWRAIALGALDRTDEAKALLAGVSPPEEPWQNTQVRADLAWARALWEVERKDEALTLYRRALESSERIGFRYYQLLARQALGALEPDDELRKRHARVASSLAKSLAANLPREDGQRFLSRGWGT